MKTFLFGGKSGEEEEEEEEKNENFSYFLSIIFEKQVERVRERERVREKKLLF